MNNDLVNQTLGHIASSLPGATRVFHDFGVDFCCGGSKTLREMACQQMLDITAIVAALNALDATAQPEKDWRKAAPADLIDHIVARFHERHRQQLPELIRLSRRVEQVHAGKPGCPTGLADILEDLYQELESHMLKEERVLFPMLTRGMTDQAQTPISVLRIEHDHHGHALEAALAAADQLALPEHACNTWRALYAGLQEFKEDLMEHIHLENNVLFLNASGGEQGAIHG